MTKSHSLNRATSLLVIVSLAAGMVSALSLPQGVSGGAFQGQDIMGGAAIVFKRPQRVRDIVGGAAMLVVKRQPRPPVRPTEVARNDRRRPRPGEPEVADARISEADKGEAFKNQGNTYYD